jgi:hypothetical protein
MCLYLKCSSVLIAVCVPKQYGICFCVLWEFKTVVQYSLWWLTYQQFWLMLVYYSAIVITLFTSQIRLWTDFLLMFLWYMNFPSILHVPTILLHKLLFFTNIDYFHLLYWCPQMARTYWVRICGLSRDSGSWGYEVKSPPPPPRIVNVEEGLFRNLQEAAPSPGHQPRYLHSLKSGILVRGWSVK